ncbi:hypothetical protein BOTBODRAFT_244375 [Botryobasidium botryosum FD-172 SS1]|uniref:Uncharacterized protein n=1 Tax=Botryobasidium botryosum (strain FD-172 SS1) TaxID=930990 RepID=A0A067M536_BOTB1|nr:hypothetical protein BOTBODRAFT_244375 [Botryobasidium botryosum FD-172 SS1]
MIMDYLHDDKRILGTRALVCCDWGTPSHFHYSAPFTSSRIKMAQTASFRFATITSRLFIAPTTYSFRLSADLHAIRMPEDW